MKQIGVSILLLLFALPAIPALADVEVQFYTENDGFSISNLDNCALSDVEIMIDISSSAGGLVFDTFPGPPGLNQSQSLRIISGSDFLAQTPVTRDGSQSLSLNIKELPSDGFILIGVDTDSRESPWSNVHEIKGGIAKIAEGEIAVFDNKGTALIPKGGCKTVS